ncbi:hypothetical protein N7467_006934 [Penicillium canescens]|nr:hypothetical protein N7467_006934 [Penicillium canescens]
MNRVQLTGCKPRPGNEKAPVSEHTNEEVIRNKENHSDVFPSHAQSLDGEQTERNPSAWPL